ncbi:MAG: beta-glucosidase [Clostridiales bacterium]|nr:beta-glucosidase [Clostridiales bacterium]
MKAYMDKSLSPEKRAELLLAEMSLDEKMWQISGEMIFGVDEPDYEEKRENRHGHYRNPGHFMHYKREVPATPREVAERINRDVKLTMEASENAIPPIQNGEALHGAQWGMATCFPQPISMASTFDDELMAKVGDIVGKECIAVGVRQVFAPVINVTRDCRWGRTMETYGEDAMVNANMGVAMCRGLEKNGVIATPKHYVDNYAAGGRDSNYSDTSERTLREVFLKPFEKCFKEGGAHSVMASYNAWDGMPCSCNRRLLDDILRKEWGFDGFVVSDYGGVGGSWGAHRVAATESMAHGKCIEAGLDINLPNISYHLSKKAYEDGHLSEEALNKAVLRVLKMKFAIGLMDDPFVDAEKANEIVRCAEHKQVALDAARESIILLKNEGVLPLDKAKIKKLGVFGSSADIFPVGQNYSGPYGRDWEADDAVTPIEYLKKYLEGTAEVIYASEAEIETVAPQCDACLYFTTVVEGEGLDRCNIKLPKMAKAAQEDEAAMIVGKIEFDLKEDQEAAISKMLAANENSVVMLLNGAPIDMSAWMDGAKAIVEAWYPGEQGSQAMCEIIFGECNPSAKLPITFPRSVGQLPLFYDFKPSGRGYAYNDNDGTPLYAFGYGLSYTNFEIGNVAAKAEGTDLTIDFTLTNTGNFDGTEVVQVYFRGMNCDVVMPIKSLKAYKRVSAAKGETVSAQIKLDKEAFCYWNLDMKFDMHDGDYKVMIGNASDNIVHTFEVKVRGGKVEMA